MIDKYLKLLTLVCSQPRMSEELCEEECSLLRAGKMSTQDWKRALRSPSVQWYLSTGTGKAPMIVRNRLQKSMNHPVHRAIIWMSHQVLAPATQIQKKRYRQLLIQHGWNEIKAAPATNSALMVLFNDPTYASLYKLGRKIMQQKEQTE